MGIVYFIVYLCVGYILMNAMLNFSSDDLDTAEAIAAYTVVVLFGLLQWHLLLLFVSWIILEEIMDDLVKALKCRQAWHENWCTSECSRCEFYQEEYVNMSDVLDKAAIELVKLDKSNRNWRRKVQRLRNKIKEG